MFMHTVTLLCLPGGMQIRRCFHELELSEFSLIDTKPFVNHIFDAVRTAGS